MLKRAQLSLLALLLILPLPLGAAGGFAFLRLPLSARATAMGEAVTALADDISSASYNPAGISFIDRRTAAASYLHYVSGIQAGQLSLAQPRLAGGTGRLGLCYLYSGSIEETSLEMPTGTGRSFSFTSAVLSLSYGWSFDPQLSIGATAKGIYEKAGEYTSSAVALDLGAIYELDLQAISSRLLRSDNPRNLGKSLALGASIQNLGMAADAFIEVKEKLPLTLRLGLAYQPFPDRLMLGLGGVKAVDVPVRLQAGLEYWIRNLLCLRAGYNGMMADIQSGSSWDDLVGFACGLGLRYRGYTVGMAYTPFGGLGYPLRFELAAEY